MLPFGLVWTWCLRGSGLSTTTLTKPPKCDPWSGMMSWHCLTQEFGSLKDKLYLRNNSFKRRLISLMSCWWLHLSVWGHVFAEPIPLVTKQSIPLLPPVQRWLLVLLGATRATEPCPEIVAACCLFTHLLYLLLQPCWNKASPGIRTGKYLQII